MDIETLKNKHLPAPIAIWCITPNGKVLGQKIQRALTGSFLFVPEKMWDNFSNQKSTGKFKTLSTEIGIQFNKYPGHVFIFAAGIGVRIIAPLLKSKTIDPAVVVVDDNGNHAISLLSGHLGGANHLAETIACTIKATPVITTATDTNRLPSIDLIAKDAELFIETPQNIKHVNMAFLVGEPVSLYDPFGLIKKTLPAPLWSAPEEIAPRDRAVFCSYETETVSRETLVLRPPVLSVGIGCNRGTGCDVIKAFLMSVLKKEHLSEKSIYRFATTRVKEDEKGLLCLSKEMDIPIDFYDRDTLNSVKTIKTPSKMVEKHLGVKSVCEAASILSANSGNLIVTKKKNKDVTIAVAIKK